MAYQVLARKYRPQRFSDVIGQDHVTRTLGNALEQNRIAHGYIFSGHRGIGKTTIARILAMALNCRRAIGTAERPTYEPCGTCESCEEVRAGNAVDVIEIDAATNRGIDEIRELRDAARYRPARDRYKIYILDEAHQITDAAFNALLKTLEEPPDHVVFMMATTQPEDILQTIRSRCQHFSFHAVKYDAILVQLRTIAAEEQVSAEEEALGLLAEAGDGSMRDALSIMDQAIASAPLEGGRARLAAAQVRELMGSMPNAVFARLLESVSENSSAAVLVELDRLLSAGNSASQIARQMVRYLRNVLMARIAGEATELLQLSPDERARAAASALLFGEDELTRFLQIMLRTFDELNYRQEQRFHLELGVLKLVHLQRLLPVEDLLSQLGAPAGRATPPRNPARATPLRTAPPAASSLTPPSLETDLRQPAAPAAQTRPQDEGAGPSREASRGPSREASREASSEASRGPSREASREASSEASRGPSREASRGLNPGPVGGFDQVPAQAAGEAAIAAPTAPTFSPFERDARRKATPSLSRVPPAAPLPVQVAATPAALASAVPNEHAGAQTQPSVLDENSPRQPASVPAGASVPQAAPELQDQAAPRSQPAGDEPNGSQPEQSSEPDMGTQHNAVPTLPKAPGSGPASSLVSASAASTPQASAPQASAPQASTHQARPASGSFVRLDLDRIREAACGVLEAAGHSTAATLLGAGTWSQTKEGVRVEMAAKKTMLGLTMNGEADRLARAAMRPHLGNPPLAVQWVPGEGGSGKAATRPAAVGSVQALALENPLVQQARQLFQAEIRSVVDLRDKLKH